MNYSADLSSRLVYNHVLKLDLGSLTWTLVDNYGDIPGVRMGMKFSNEPVVMIGSLIGD